MDAGLQHLSQPAGVNTGSYFNLVAWNSGTALAAVRDGAFDTDAAVVQLMAVDARGRALRATAAGQ